MRAAEKLGIDYTSDLEEEPDLWQWLKAESRYLAAEERLSKRERGGVYNRAFRRYNKMQRIEGIK